MMHTPHDILADGLNPDDLTGLGLEAEFRPYYERHGLRRYDQLTNPPMSPMVTFELPYYSIIHYLPENTVEYGPSIDNPILQSVGGQKFVDHILEMKTQEGNPIWAKLVPDSLVRSYRKLNREFRRMGRLDQISRDRNTVVIENYAILGHLWWYRDTYLTARYRWMNIRNTLWANVEAIGKQLPNHNQFVFLDLPAFVPSLQDFNIASLRTTRDTVRKFPDNSAMDLLDLFTWAGPERGESLLSAVSVETLQNVNIVFQESGYWTILNLGRLNQWIKGEGLGKEAEIARGKDPRMMQKAVLGLFQRILAVRSAPGSNVLVSEPNTPDPVLVIPETDVAPLTVQAPVELVQQTSPLGIKLPQMPTFEPIPTADLPPANTKPKPITLSPIEKTDSVVKAFWDLDKPPSNLEELLQPVTSEYNKKFTGTLGQYDLGVLDTAAKYHAKGLLTNAEFGRFEQLAGKFREITVGDNGKTLADVCVIDPAVIQSVEAIKLPDIPTVLDKSMLVSTLSQFDRKYIREVMESDIANMFMAPQRAGIALTGFTKERVEDVGNKYDLYTIAYTPVDGERSIVRAKLPVVELDGHYKINNVRSFLKKQRMDLPIRKVAPNKVALTSYYGKVFVWRAEKVAYDYGKWLVKEISKGMGAKETKYSKVRTGTGIYQTELVPRIYSILANDFIAFTYGPYEFSLQYKNLETNFGKELCQATTALIPIGWLHEGKNRIPMVVGLDDVIYRTDTDTPLGTIEELLDISVARRPMDVAELRVFGKMIPMGIVLGLHYGIDKLLELLQVTPDRVPVGERLLLKANEFSIRFQDQTLVFNQDNRLANIILAGFNVYKDQIARYAYEDYNEQGAYLNVLEGVNLGARYAREVELQFDMFIDHITRGILEEMPEPTEYGPLLVRACQLLLNDQCPDETDMNWMRLAGYERMAGAIYKELVLSMRSQRARPAGLRGALDVNPEAVWRRIQADGSSQQTEDSTPVHNLKEQEAITFGGDGGRGFRSMVRSSRVFHPSDLGTVSEATVDSSAVAINTSAVANPKFKSLRGLTSRYDPKKDGPSSLVSTSLLLSPAADMDDRKRQNFISIQHSSGIAAAGYEISPVCTGMEKVIAHRTGPLFASTSRAAGKVISVNDEYMVIEYDDPTLARDHIRIGLQHGIVAGTVLPHNVVTNLKVGDSVVEGQVVATNDKFFKWDMLDPTQAIYMPGMWVRTLLIDSTDTLEDSSGISQEVGQRLATEITYPRTIIVDGTQVLHNLVEVGDTVGIESILCSIEDPLTANAGLFEKDAYDTLRLLAAQSPRAKYAGKVDFIEVFYNGDPDTFNESIADVVRMSDRIRARRAKRAGGDGAVTGKVNESIRIDGNSLSPGQIAIKIYITTTIAAGVGDKGVFGNQMKTTFGRVMTGVNMSYDGQTIDAIFGYQSISDRIVLSPEVMGTTATLAFKLRELVVEAYRK